MADTQFEAKFAAMVDGELTAKVPSLIDFRVGFQVVDKNDDETRAFAITGFVVNDMWIYSLAFFNNGRIKGMDQLWLKQPNLVCPARDNWIAKIRSQAGEQVGDALPAGSLPWLATSSPAAVSIAPQGLLKMASADVDMLMTTEDIDRATMQYEKRPDISLMGNVEKFSKRAQAEFAHILRNDPDVANAFLKCYTVAEFNKLASVDFPSVFPKPPDNKTDSTPPKERVKVITRGSVEKDPSILAGMSDEDKRMLMAHGMFVLDNRTSFPNVYYEAVSADALSEVGNSGFWNILGADGEMPKFFVLTDRHTCSSTCGNNGAILFPLQGRQTQYCTISKQLYGRPVQLYGSGSAVKLPTGQQATRRNLSSMAFSKPDNPDFSGIGDMDTPSSRTAPNRILILETPDTWYEIRVREENGSLLGQINAPDNIANAANPGGHGWQENWRALVFTDNGTLMYTEGSIFIPKNCRLYTEQHDDIITPGTPDLLRTFMQKTAGMVSLEVQDRDGQYMIRKNGVPAPALDMAEALNKLACDFGIYGGQCRHILKDASRMPFKEPLRLVVKTASLDPATEEYGARSSFQNMARPTPGEPAQTIDQPVSPQGIRPHQAQALMTAADSGVKEVMDVAAVKLLTELDNVSDINKELITGMITGMDSLGRALYAFYWRMDDFSEHYGEEELAQMEEGLRKAFLATGDVVIFLREKTDIGDPGQEQMQGTLSENLGE